MTLKYCTSCKKNKREELIGSDEKEPNYQTCTECMAKKHRKAIMAKHAERQEKALQEKLASEQASKDEKQKLKDLEKKLTKKEKQLTKEQKEKLALKKKLEEQLKELNK